MGHKPLRNCKVVGQALLKSRESAYVSQGCTAYGVKHSVDRERLGKRRVRHIGEQTVAVDEHR